MELTRLKKHPVYVTITLPEKMLIFLFSFKKQNYYKCFTGATMYVIELMSDSEMSSRTS